MNTISRSFCGVLAFLGWTCLFVCGCGQGTSEQAAESTEKPVVIAVNYPLASAAHLLAGEQMELLFPVPAGIDPAYWKPQDTDVLAMQEAALVLLNGAGHEPWASRVTLSPLNVTRTSVGFRDQWIEADLVTHSHGPGGEHTHASIAPTTWLDPLLFSEQVTVTARSLQKLLPAERDVIESRYQAALSRLSKLDADWKEISQQWGDQPLLASHPVYQYPARRYQWNVKSLHWEPEEAPTAKQWQEFDELLKSHPARLMLWEAEPLPETQQQLTDRNIQVIVLPTLAHGDPADSVLDAMEATVQGIAKQVKKP